MVLECQQTKQLIPARLISFDLTNEKTKTIHLKKKTFLLLFLYARQILKAYCYFFPKIICLQGCIFSPDDISEMLIMHKIKVDSL